MPGTLIKVEYNSKPSRTIRVYKCLADNCYNEVRIRDDNKTHSGMCQVHSHRKRPFESIYNGLSNDWRQTPVELSYEDFIEFTKITECHYCGDNIPWSAFSSDSGQFISRAYFLDRKNHDLGYSRINCVVCCTECNKTRSNRFTYEEFLLLSPILKKIKANRNGLANR